MRQHINIKHAMCIITSLPYCSTSLSSAVNCQLKFPVTHETARQISLGTQDIPVTVTKIWWVSTVESVVLAVHSMSQWLNWPQEQQADCQCMWSSWQRDPNVTCLHTQTHTHHACAHLVTFVFKCLTSQQAGRWLGWCC